MKKVILVQFTKTVFQWEYIVLNDETTYEAGATGRTTRKAS